MQHFITLHEESSGYARVMISECWGRMIRDLGDSFTNWWDLLCDLRNLEKLLGRGESFEAFIEVYDKGLTYFFDEYQNGIESSEYQVYRFTYDNVLNIARLEKLTDV